jgi:hypothetical protein
MMASIYSSIHEDDGIEATVLQGVVATVEEVLESSDEDEEETQWGGCMPPLFQCKGMLHDSSHGFCWLGRPIHTSQRWWLYTPYQTARFGTKL